MTASSFANITCPTCGAASTVPIDALLISVADGDSDAGLTSDQTAAVVTWVCDDCADLARIEATWPMLLTLVTAGATLLDEAPEDLPEHPEHPAGGAALVPDDLLALHELLGSDTWFAELSSTPTVQP
jgi:hypothetical protein